MYGTTVTQSRWMQTQPFHVGEIGSVQGVLLAEVPEVVVGNSSHSDPSS